MAGDARCGSRDSMRRSQRQFFSLLHIRETVNKFSQVCALHRVTSLRLSPSHIAQHISRKSHMADIKKAEAARLKALRDADDDWDPNAGKSAIEIGKLDVWEQEENVKNADGTLADTAFDGFMRLGTNREILSWPGNSGETYLVRTEGDEAKAQARLKRERNQLRSDTLDKKAEEGRQAAHEKHEREKAFKERQREVQRQEKEDLRREKLERQKALGRDAKVRSFAENTKLYANALFGKPQPYRSPDSRGGGSPKQSMRGSPTAVAAGPESPV